MSETVLRVHVTPRSSRNAITGWRDGVLCVKLTAPPVEGAANEAVVRFIADALGVKRSQVELVSGEKSRDKTIRITGLTDSEIRAALT